MPMPYLVLHILKKVTRRMEKKVIPIEKNALKLPPCVCLIFSSRAAADVVVGGK